MFLEVIWEESKKSFTILRQQFNDKIIELQMKNISISELKVNYKNRFEVHKNLNEN